MNIILFDGNSTDPISQIIAVAPGDCVLLNAWGLAPGELAQVYRALVALGNIPQQQSGSCLPPPQVTPAAIQNETPYFPCNVTVGVGQQPDMNQTSIVIQQPGFYRVHLTPSALGVATVEAVVLTGVEACEQAASQCCCLPETFWSGSSANPCLTITPGGEAGHSPVFNLDACCLLHAFPALPVPAFTDELVVLSGGACFRSTIAQVFDPAIICTTLGSYLLQLPLAGDTLVVVDAGANCKRVDGETFVEFFETPWTGISVTPALTITPGGINGHGPTFAYDLCADLQAIPACACEPVAGDLVPIIQGGACTLAQWPVVSACEQMGAFATGALVAGDTVFVREAGGACKQVDADDFLVTPFPLLAPDGSCASPSYSFTSSPDSGMFYDPAGVGSVIIGDDNCTDFISIGASILLQTAASNITANAGVDVILVGANDATLQATAGAARMLGAGGTAVVQIDAAGNITAVNSTAASWRVLTSGSVAANTAGLAFEITSSGEFVLNGNPGVAGQVVSSQGPGLPPIWTAAGGLAFPILAPDGTCAAPSYSFSGFPASGMLYFGDRVRIADATCTDFIDVGGTAGVSLFSSTADISVSAGDDLNLQAGIGDVNIVAASDILGTASAGEVRFDAQTDVVLRAATGSANLIAAVAGVVIDAATTLTVLTGAALRLVIGATGTWSVAGSIGTAGQILTSNGAGTSPTWQAAPAPSFPLLAPSGSCAAPSYSFTASPDSGMFYTGTAVRIGDDNCVDFIEVGASINLTSAGTVTTTAGGSIVETAAAAVSITATAGALALSAGTTASLTGGTSVAVTATAGLMVLSAPTLGVAISGGVGGVGISFTTTALALQFFTGGEWLVGGVAGTAGQFLQSAGPGTIPAWATVTGFAVSGQMVWGAANVGSAAETRVVPVGYDDTLISTATPKGFSSPRAGTYRNLRVRYNTTNGNGNAAVWTMRVNGVNTALSVSRATGAIGTTSDTVNTVAVAAGDLIELIVVKALAIGSGVLEAFISAEFA